MSNEPKGFNPSDHIIRVQGNRAYLPVSAAIAWFRTEHPDWSIICEVSVCDDSCLATATVKNEVGSVVATAHKQESQRSFPDFVEKAESGAVGRALRFAGFGTADIDVDNQQLDGASPTAGMPQSRALPQPDVCVICGAEMTIGQAWFAKQRFGRVLCSKCQKAQK